MLYYDKKLLIRIDKETYEELKKIAKLKKLKMAELIRLIIYREINNFRKNEKNRTLV